MENDIHFPSFLSLKHCLNEFDFNKKNIDFLSLRTPFEQREKVEAIQNDKR